MPAILRCVFYLPYLLVVAISFSSLLLQSFPFHYLVLILHMIMKHFMKNDYPFFSSKIEYKN